MEIIIHRVNKIDKLKKIPKEFGVEVDIRSFNSKLILNHDPHLDGDSFINYLDAFNHGTLILNIKEAGIELEVIKLVKSYKLKSYFLLDVEIPFLFVAMKNNVKEIAIRYSEFEPIEFSKQFVNKFNWVWIDTITKLPINKKISMDLKNYKKCLVCPERWGRKDEIIQYKNYLIKNNINIDAVMTSIDCHELWI